MTTIKLLLPKDMAIWAGCFCILGLFVLPVNAEVITAEIISVKARMISPVVDSAKSYPDISSAQTAMLKQGANRAAFSLTVRIPKSLCYKDDTGLYLGVIYDQDKVFLNGELIGITADPDHVDFRKTAEPRLYLLPKRILKCDQDNIVDVDARSLVGKRLGPLGTRILLGPWWELEIMADHLREYLLFFREIGFLMLSVTLLLLVLFRKYSQNRRQIAFVSFAFWSGMMCVSLSGWAFSLINYPEFLYLFHAALVCVMLVEFNRLLALYAETVILPGLSHLWSGLVSLIFFCMFFMVIPPGNMVQVYRFILLGLIASSMYFLVRGYLLEYLRMHRVQAGLLMLVLIGVMSDTARIWGLHSGPNISAYFIAISVLGLGFILTSDLVEVFKLAADRQRGENEKEIYKSLSNLAQQVAHDIRSPLAALDTVVGKTDQLPEQQRIMVRHAVNRIRDIANNLLEKNRQQGKTVAIAGSPTTENKESPATRLLSSIIDPVITEKRLQFESKPGINIDFELTKESYGLFARIQPVEFRRIVSNLVNNAVEVLGDKGKVAIGLVQDEINIILTVTDNGKGIPPEILEKLGQKGETHGKAGGSGLGLYHARTTVENWGGGLTIASEVGKGTTVTIKLPKAETPESFVPVLELISGRPVVVLDDDATIHQIWDGRFESSRVKEYGIEVIHFSEPDKLRQWVKNNTVKGEKAVYLFDYELLGYKETGLSLAEELNLCDKTILVTSRCEEKRIIDECKRLEVRMIPKGLAGFVPVSTGSPKTGRAVLIDDDALTHMTWELAAEQNGIELSAFTDPAGFLANLEKFPKDIPLYIDSNLGENIKGEDIAADLKEKGFTNICLATGYEPGKFSHLPWLKVICKEPPWGKDEG